MKYTGVVDFDFLTLIQILAMAEDPSCVEFYDDSANFLGRIYIANGCLKGAICGDLTAEAAFVELVVSQTKARGTFRKVSYVEPDDKIATNTRIDALLLSAIADKETEEGQQNYPHDSVYATESQIITGSSYAAVSASHSDQQLSPELESLDDQLRAYIIPGDLFNSNLRHISNVFSLFNIESIMLYTEISGHLIVFTERYWKSLFAGVDPDNLDEHGIQAHTCFIMAEITRRYLGEKNPNFDATFLGSEELLAQVDIAIHEATQDDKEVKIIKITPGQSYDEHMSYVSGFSESTLKEPNTQLEQLYKWLDRKLKIETAPLRYFFYPEKKIKTSTNRCKGPFRIVIATPQDLCDRICVNIKHYLGSDNIAIYSITNSQEFQAVERSDWEDCHLVILHHSLLYDEIYDVLDHIPESMSICMIAEPRTPYRKYLSAPIFRERIQGIYTSADYDLANLISRIFEIASFQIEGDA